jgi:hypothetical protein
VVWCTSIVSPHELDFCTLQDGNEAAAPVVRRVSEVIAIYPITPSSAMGEQGHTKRWRNTGKIGTSLSVYLAGAFCVYAKLQPASHAIERPSPEGEGFWVD